MSNDLILFHGPGVTLADIMRAAVQAEGLEALVKDAKTQVRTALADAVTNESERTGTQFTAKLDGWSAQWTDPDPKPSVSDREAFGDWFGAETIPIVDVSDGGGAYEALVWADEINADPTAYEPDDVLDCLTKLASSLGNTTEYILPADPFTPLIDSGRCKIHGNPDDGYQLVDTDTGEAVPGVTVTRARPQLRLVPKGKAQRQAAKRDVAEVLGINPAALEGGA